MRERDAPKFSKGIFVTKVIGAGIFIEFTRRIIDTVKPILMSKWALEQLNGYTATYNLIDKNFDRGVMFLYLLILFLVFSNDIEHLIEYLTYKLKGEQDEI